MKGLADKAFLVTGGGSGIGAATVHRLLEEGAFVVAGDISEAGLAATVAAAVHPDRLKTVVFDLGVEKQVVDLVAIAAAAFGRLDGVANVAADVSPPTMMSDVEIGEMDAAHWEHVLRVNLIGTAAVIREALPHLAKAGGSIVNTSSAAAWLGEDVRPAYASSKIGLHAVTRHTARAWGAKRVRCNLIAPGMVLSESGASLLPQEYRDKMLELICLPCLGVPEDIAATIAFLLSDEASWITGQILSIDGGLVFRE